MNWPTMRVKGPIHGDSFEAFHVPHKHHLVWIECHSSHIEIVNSHSYYVCKLRFLVLCDLDFAIASHDVRGAEWWWLTQAHQVLQVVCSEDAYDTIGASTEQASFLGLAAESPGNLDVHPLEKFALFIEHVDVTIWCQCKNSGSLNCQANEYLQFDFSKISRDWLKYLIVTLRLCDWLPRLFIEIPVLQVLIAASNEIVLLRWYCDYHCWLSQSICADLLLVPPVPDEEPSVVRIAEWDEKVISRRKPYAFNSIFMAFQVIDLPVFLGLLYHYCLSSFFSLLWLNRWTHYRADSLLDFFVGNFPDRDLRLSKRTLSCRQILSIVRKLQALEGSGRAWRQEMRLSGVLRWVDDQIGSSQVDEVTIRWIDLNGSSGFARSADDFFELHLFFTCFWTATIFSGRLWYEIGPEWQPLELNALRRQRWSLTVLVRNWNTKLRLMTFD